MNYEWGNSPEVLADRVIVSEFYEISRPGEVSIEKPDVSTMAERKSEYTDKLIEIRDNLEIVEDPQSPEYSPPVTAEITVANADRLKDGKGVVLQVSTSGSTMVENPSNGVEMADNALLNPDYAFIYMASLGNGGTSGLVDAELERAKKDGSLIWANEIQGGIAVPTIRAIARALDTVGEITHVSSDDTGAHISSALLAALPENQAQSAFLYNPKNLRDLSRLRYGLGMLKAMTVENYAYGLASDDPLKVDGSRREDAKKIFGKDFKDKVERKRASAGTFNPGKMKDETDIFRRGPAHGSPAVKHTVAALDRHEDLRITYALPTESVNYPGKEEVDAFLGYTRWGHLRQPEGEDGYGRPSNFSRTEVLEIPIGHYGHTHYPTGRLALQAYAFNR